MRKKMIIMKEAKNKRKEIRNNISLIKIKIEAEAKAKVLKYKKL